MAKKIKNIVKPSYPRMGMPMNMTGVKNVLHRRAKFAPQLIADGFIEGVAADQGNLLKSAYDDPKSDVVDPFTNIDSDKFLMMAQEFHTTEVDPVQPSDDSN